MTSGERDYIVVSIDASLPHRGSYLLRIRISRNRILGEWPERRNKRFRGVLVLVGKSGEALKSRILSIHFTSEAFETEAAMGRWLNSSRS